MNYDEKLSKLEWQLEKSIKKVKKRGYKISSGWGVSYCPSKEKFVPNDEKNKQCCALGAILIDLQPEYSPPVFLQSLQEGYSRKDLKNSRHFGLSKLFNLSANYISLFTESFDSGIGDPKKSKIRALALKIREKYLK